MLLFLASIWAVIQAKFERKGAESATAQGFLSKTCKIGIACIWAAVSLQQIRTNENSTVRKTLILTLRLATFRRPLGQKEHAIANILCFLK